MSQFDSNGWAPIHAAAFKGYSVDKFISDDPEKLEWTTTDDLQSTPLLLAVMSGNIETVTKLVDLGANITAKNTQGHGIIELACLKIDTAMLQFIIDNCDSTKLTIYKDFVNFILCKDHEQACRASESLYKVLLTYNQLENHDKIKNFIDSDLIETIIRVIDKHQDHDCKRLTLLALLVVIKFDIAQEKFISDGLKPLMNTLRPPSISTVATIALQIIENLIIGSNENAESVLKAGIFQDLNRILEWNRPLDVKEDEQGEIVEDNDSQNDDLLELEMRADWCNKDLLIEIVKITRTFCKLNKMYQDAILKESNFIEAIVSLYQIYNSKSLVMELTMCIAKIASNHSEIQEKLRELQVDDNIIPLIRSKDPQFQLLATEAIHELTQNNIEYSNHLMDKQSHKPLLMMLRRAGRNVLANEKAAVTLWTFAGNSTTKKREMAELITIEKLLDFLLMNSETLQLIGSEALNVISDGPLSRRDYISKLNGVSPLVKLLNSSNNQIVMSSIKTIRQLCLGIGWLPHRRNQHLVLVTRGLQTLVGLMRFSQDELVQVEAAFTVGSSVMRYEEALIELHSNPKFNYIYILEKLYSNDDQVRLIAGSALTSFAYNNISEQRQIAMCGGIRFDSIRPYLDSNNDYDRIMAAFQMVILARVIPDEELSISTAIALKTFVNTLAKSTDNKLQEFASCCIARLCHTRAGIASGLISLNIVDILCCLVLSYDESVRGTAAIAIQYLSHYPESRRQILRKCRRDPYLMKAVKFYNSTDTIDTNFVEVWKHYEKVGLPKINKSRPLLSNRSDYNIFQEYDARQLTIFSTGHESNTLNPLIYNKLPPIESARMALATNNDHTDQIIEIEQLPDQLIQSDRNNINGEDRDNDNDDTINMFLFNDRNSKFEETQLSLTSQ